MNQNKGCSQNITCKILHNGIRHKSSTTQAFSVGVYCIGVKQGYKDMYIKHLNLRSDSKVTMLNFGTFVYTF